jgi:ubiquinone/menaquinone biosynthesis C-methylase UbiE
MADSVAFDRAAAYYDRTRGFTPEGERRTIELLSGELAGRGRIVEIGVGTGQVALPLHAAGIDVVGVDLARPMMDRLVEKAGGRPTIPLVQGDATRLPLRDGAFGGAYFRWVLHLIPDWGSVMRELVRVVGLGGRSWGTSAGDTKAPDPRYRIASRRSPASRRIPRDSPGTGGPSSTP